MATKPRRACQHPGCSALAIQGASRCVRHHRVRIDTRPSAARRGYNAEWQRIRNAVMSEEPWCRAGCGKPSVLVDHIIPLRNGGTHARGNLQALCDSCHKRKTHSDKLRFGMVVTR